MVQFEKTHESKFLLRHSEVMRPLLRHDLGQHSLKTVVRSNFRSEMAEK